MPQPNARGANAAGESKQEKYDMQLKAMLKAWEERRKAKEKAYEVSADSIVYRPDENVWKEAPHLPRCW